VTLAIRRLPASERRSLSYPRAHWAEVSLRATIGQAGTDLLFLRGGRLTDPQRFQCWTIDLTGNGQIVVGLKPANRFCCLRADQAIDWPVIVTELRQLLLHGHNGVL
jgi:hypothetical protein